MTSCPSRLQLQQLAAERLSAFDRASVETHIDSCLSCQETLVEIRKGDHTYVSQLEPDDAAQQQKEPELSKELLEHPRYRILGLIGSGGMGAVYKAEHRLLERLVALKVIRQDLFGNSELLVRFQRETKLAARLAHPNIVTVYEAERLGAIQMLVLEFIEGANLAELIKERGPMPVAVSCEMIRQAAMGLQYLHEQGMVHRDIKPANLMLTDGGQVKLLDLGLAMLKVEEAPTSGLTRPHQLLGTVDFGAPEQWEDSHGVDIRADIYSLGCTLYFLLAGQAPFSGSRFTTVMKQMRAHSQESVPPIRESRKDVPEELAAVLERMLAKSPADRFATPGDLARALEPFAADCDLAAFKATGTIRTSPSSGVGNSFSGGSGTSFSRGSLPTIAVGAKPAEANPPQAVRRRMGRWIAAGVTVPTLFGVALCLFLMRDRTEPGSVGPPRGPVGQPIRVGILHSQTGTMAISESAVIDATILAIEEINNQGGVLGRKIEPIIEDGQSDWPTFKKKADKLITQDQVCTVFGCWTSASRKTVKPVFEEHNHLLFYPVQYEGLEQSPNIIYTGAAPNQQIIPAVKWFCDVMKKKRLFLVGSDYVFPRSANEIIKEQASALGAEIVGEEYVLLSSADVADVIKRIQQAQPEVILNTLNGDTNVAFFRALRAAGITSAQIPTVSFSITEEELKTFSIKDLVGDYAAWNYFMTIDSSSNHDFVSRFQAKFGKQRVTNDPMEAAYFGVHLWAQAVKAANSDDVQAIRKALKGQTFRAPEGPIKIDLENNHTWKFVRIGKITEEGRFNVVYESDSALEPIPYPSTRSRENWNEFLNDLHLKWGQWANPGR